MKSAVDNVYRLNIYYLLLEKMHNFADENKWDLSNVPGSQIAQEYEEKRTDAWANIEELGIIKRIVSVCKLEFVFYLAAFQRIYQRDWYKFLVPKTMVPG